MDTAGGMSQQDRCDMENVMVKAFNGLIKDPAYGGRYVSLTPGHPNKISVRPPAHSFSFVWWS